MELFNQITSSLLLIWNGNFSQFIKSDEDPSNHELIFKNYNIFKKQSKWGPF